MKDTEYVTGEDRLRGSASSGQRGLRWLCNIEKIVMKRIFMSDCLAVAENKRSK